MRNALRGNGVHQERVNVVDLLLGMTRVKVRRSASFGSRGDVIGETNANSNMKGSPIAPGRRHQHDHPQLIQRETNAERVGAQQQAKGL